jgi:hypothetical protein
MIRPEDSNSDTGFAPVPVPVPVPTLTPASASIETNNTAASVSVSAADNAIDSGSGSGNDSIVHIHHNLMLSNDSALASLCTQPGGPKYALILLNNVLLNAGLVRRLWACSSLVLCADGAANRLRDLHLSDTSGASGASGTSPITASSAHARAAPLRAGSAYCPDAIVGDMDSLEGGTRDYYRAQGVGIVHVGDQDSTDLDKCLDFALARQRHGIETVIASIA